jgi:uncharacterized repeat protein (TIGR01451 family)
VLPCALGKFGLVVARLFSERFPDRLESWSDSSPIRGWCSILQLSAIERMKIMNATKTPRTNLLSKWTGALLVLGLFPCAPSWAASPAGSPGNAKNDLSISLTAKRVVTQADGKERLMPADRAFPGEVIQYDALYQNQTAKPLHAVAPTLPIPGGMVFVPNSASPAPTEASLDGKTFQKIPIVRKVTLPNGEQKEMEVSPTEYRALRWHAGELAAGANTTVTARTRLIPVGNQ